MVSTHSKFAFGSLDVSGVSEESKVSGVLCFEYPDKPLHACVKHLLRGFGVFGGALVYCSCLGTTGISLEAKHEFRLGTLLDPSCDTSPFMPGTRNSSGHV